MSPFSYPEVGATRTGRVPDGYRLLTHRSRLPAGALRAAAEAMMTWRMHRGVGLRVAVSAPRAEVGATVTSRLGLGQLGVPAPCRVVWTVEEPDRVGFAIGTLPGHPVRGEESFVVSRDADRTVWFTLTSFSRPARWYARVAGPVMPLLQRAYARRCAQVLRRLCQRPPAPLDGGQ